VSQTGGRGKFSNAGADQALQSDPLLDEPSTFAASAKVMQNPRLRFREELVINERIGQIQYFAAREHDLTAFSFQ